MNGILKTIHWRAFFITFIAEILLVGCCALIPRGTVNSAAEMEGVMTYSTLSGNAKLANLWPKWSKMSGFKVKISDNNGII